MSMASEDLAQPTVVREGETLIVQWDNLALPKDRFVTVFLAGFWLIWTPCTALMTYNFLNALLDDDAMKHVPALLAMLLWLVFGYYGVYIIPKTWLIRSTVERIEIDNHCYRHYFVNRKWLFPKRWPTRVITSIEYGKHGRESVPTLSVRRPFRRDLIAYWATAEFRWKLFQLLRDHLEEIGSPIPVTTV